MSEHEHAWQPISAFGSRCSVCGDETFSTPVAASLAPCQFVSAYSGSTCGSPPGDPVHVGSARPSMPPHDYREAPVVVTVVVKPAGQAVERS